MCKTLLRLTVKKSLNWISLCFVDISTWMKELHHKLNLPKTQFIFLPACTCKPLKMIQNATVAPRFPGITHPGLHSLLPATLCNERRLVLPSQHGISSVVPKWWNEQPNSSQSAQSLLTFKRKLKTQLLREHFCTYLCSPQ